MRLPVLSKLLILYTAGIWILSLTSVCWEWNDVPFSYNTILQCSEVISSANILITQIICLVVGSAVTQALPIRTINIALPGSQSRFSFYAAIFVQIAILAWFISILANSGLNAYKPLTQKSSTLLVIISSLITVFGLGQRSLGYVHLVVSAILTLMFGLIDTSRVSIIPGAVILVYSLIAERKLLSLIGGAYAISGLVLAFGGRLDSVNNGVTLAILIENTSLEQLNYFRSYLFEFSYLHVLYTISLMPLSFDTTDLMYSLTPLPSFILPQTVDPDVWRVDIFRPYGAMAEVYNIGLIPFALFNMLFGCLSGLISKLRSRWRLFSLGFCVAFAYMASYQYGLRTIQWMMWVGLVGCITPTVTKGYSRK